MSPARRRAVVIAALTGASAIGSEALHLHALDFALGSPPMVAFGVVAAFVLGMGLGSVLSPRVRRPWRIEAVLALYHAGWALAWEPVSSASAAASGALASALGPPAAAALLGALWALPPALLLGVAFPAAVQRVGRPGSAWAAHSAGGLAGVLAVEVGLYPWVGVHGTLAVLAAVHATTATLLSDSAQYAFARQRIGRLSPTLVLVGTGTGAFQASWLFVAELLVHPFWFVKPAVVAGVMLGMALGSALWARWRWPVRVVLTACCAGIGLSAVAVAAILALPPPGSVASVPLHLLPALLPASLCIGAIYPAWLAGGEADRAEAGAALLSLAMGNALGMLVAAGLLTAHLPPLLALAATGVPVAVAASRRSERGWVAPVLLLPGLLAGTWLGDAAFIAHGRADHERVSVETRLRAPGELTVVYRVVRREPEFPDQLVRERRLYQGGYYSFALREGGGLLTEALQGAIGIGYCRRTERALILGGGTGRTAGLVALGFDHTDVVDVSSTVPALMRELEDDNWHLLDRPGVRLHRMDAVLAPRVLDRGSYDLVINTTHPSYVSRASKLYTREFLEQAAALLRPNGVYVSWADDESLSREANQVLINTGAAAFEEQLLLSLDEQLGYGYYVVLHSQAPLRFEPRRLAREELSTVPAVRALLDGSPAALRLDPRIHPTRETHSVRDPAWSVLTGGYPTYGNVKWSTW